MKKTAKKALSLFLCAVLCLSLLPVSAFAENEEAAEEVLTAEELPESGAEPIAEEPAEDPAAETVTTDDAVAIASGTCGENLTWTLDDAGLLTISGTGDMTNYSLCEAPWWENYCDVILSVVIESGVTGIGDCAFQDCRNMKSISIPEGVTRIGDYALASFDLGNRSLTEIRFPDSLTSIGKQAIYGCKAITEIRIPDGVVSIGGPFTQCDALKTISIPSSTVDIGAYLVLWCPNLTEVLVDEGNTAYTSVDGVLFSKDLKKLICFPAGKAEEYTVPEGVESIGKYAFNFSGVRKVVLPGSVVSVGEYAFYNCSSLSDITLKSGITSIGDSAFYRCSSLTGITIPDTVTEISGHAFQDCSSLTEIRFTGDAPAIGTWAFYGATATAYYPAGNETWTEELMQDYGGSLTWTAYDPGLPIDESIFPDAAFREYVTGFDSDGDGYFSAEELNAVTDISCNSKGIRDLTGIENFSRLRTLNCEWNYLENVDLSANTALEEVSLCANQLLSLNVSGLTALTSLNVGFYGYAFDDNGDPILDGPNVNKLTALDVSTNTALETLNCDANSLAALDVSGNNALTSLSCTDNKLEQLDLSANTGLLTLWVSGNPIETLDVSANTQLNFLACNATLISSLDLHANTALTGLECVDCERLTGLDLSANTELTSLVTFWSKIERLDVSENTKLETLNCSEGNLEQIVGLSRLTNLSTLFCNVNHLTALDLSCFADKESFMFDCGGQTALVSAGAGLLADGSCRVNIADLVGAENTAKVSGVTALTRADGETPELISYDEATGAAVFTAAPESIVYNYDVGCNGKKMDVTAPVSLAAGYGLTGTVVSWDGNGNEQIFLYSGLTVDEIKADISAGAAGARYTAQCGRAVQNADGKRYDVAFSFSAVEAGEYILAIYKPGNYVLKTVAVAVSGDADLGELTLQLTGDIGGDGKVNTMDLIRLMKYINGVEVDMAEGAGDVNGDGRVNTMDLIRLMKIINGETA